MVLNNFIKNRHIKITLEKYPDTIPRFFTVFPIGDFTSTLTFKENIYKFLFCEIR